MPGRHERHRSQATQPQWNPPTDHAEYLALVHAGIFRRVGTDSVREMIDQLETVYFRSGHRVFCEGEPGDRLYIVMSGKVKVVRQTADGRASLLAILGPSDMFGELAVFDPGPRTSTAVTLTAVTAAVLDRCTLQRWIRTTPGIIDQLLETLAQRLRRTHDSVTDMIFVDGPGRIAKQLLLLAHRFGTYTPAGLQLTHELTQEELAQLVGVARETASKTLADFERRQWICGTERTIVITDTERLAQRAGLPPVAAPDTGP